MSAITWNLISDPDRTNDAVFLIGLQSQTCCYVNDHACEKLGYSREELLQMGIQDIDPLIDEALIQKIADQVMTQGSILLETYHLTKDGRLFPVEVSGNIFEYQGESFGLFVAHDMTEHKYRQAEKQRLIDILEESTDFIGSADIEGKLLYHNRAAYRMVGLPDNADLSTMTISDMHPEWVMNMMQETALPTVLGHDVWHGESAVLHRDGHEIPVFQTIVLHRDANGKPEFISTIMHDLTERKQYDEHLALLDYAFNQVDEGIYLIDGNAQFVQVNEKACRDLGYTREELLQLRIFDIDPDYTPQHWEHRQDEIAKGMLSATMETRHQSKEGRIFPIEVRASYITYQGQFYDIAMVRDITKRKQTQEALQRSQSLLAEAQRIAHIGSWEVDYVNETLNWSDETFRIWEIDQSQFNATVEAFFAIVHPEDREKINNAYNYSVARKTLYQMEYRLLFPDGRVKYIAEHGEPFYDENGHVIRFVGTAMDITSRKLMELELAAREQEFHTLVDNLPTTVLRYNRYLQRIYANPTYLQMIGCSETELRNKAIDDVWRATNLSIEAYKAILHKVIHDGEKQEVSLEWTDHNGQLIYHALKIVPEYAIDGRIQSILVLGFDFSEQRRQQLVETKRQQVFEQMAHNKSLDDILKQVALYVESAKTGRYCAILLLDEDKHHLQLVAAPSFPESYCAKTRPLPLDTKNRPCHGLLASALSKQRVIIENVRKHSCYSLCQAAIQEIGAVACWSEAIMSSSDQLLGVVTLYLNSAGEPDENDLAHLQKAGHLSAIAIERKRIEQQLAYQGSYDALTGLPNRRQFNNRLQEEINKADRNGHQLAVLFIDLDHFKDVNDTLGHKIGDSLLVNTARRIQNCVRKSDTVARLGGDEFVVILPELSKVSPVERIAEAIIRAMEQPFMLGEYHTYVSASVGIAMYPHDANHAETLVSYADQAMYAAKESGRNNFNFFKRSMQEQARQRLYLINSLREALEKSQFEVHYQPIIEVASSKVVKAEALLRWHHPVLGMVSPAVFIPLAEETDLIQNIGSWVFRQAADMAKRWNVLSGENGLRKVSINMSPRQLIKGSGDQIVIDYLQAIDLDSSYIVVEITEGLLLDDSPYITEKLERLRVEGIELSLDDFGTGYSAMAYLKKFDINYLKIDRSFVHELETNPDDRAITEAIVMMAHRLGLKVIAEGVETEGQRTLLAAVGCDYIQGYLYAKPMPTKAFLSYALEHS